MENTEKQIFEENQKKQAKVVKTYLLITLGITGLILTVIAIILFFLDVEKEMPVVFISLGVVMILLGVILYFVFPTKYSYDKYKARVKKYGAMNFYEMSAKITELEERVAMLENKDKH